MGYFCAKILSDIFLGRAVRGRGHALLTGALEIAAMHWMASVFLVAVGLFMADLLCGFGFLFPAKVMRIRTSAMAFGLLLVFMAHVQGLRAPVIETHEVLISGLPSDLDGITVAVMADLHAGDLMIGPRWLNARIDQVQALRPDCILLVGDLFERRSAPYLALHQPFAFPSMELGNEGKRGWEVASASVPKEDLGNETNKPT